MSDSAVIPENQCTGQDPSGLDSEAVLRCPLPVRHQGLDALTSGLCNALEEVGCPFAPVARQRLRFETLLAELSATFINLPASQVDSRIESALRQLVEFLEVGRGGLAEVVIDQKQLVVTHSYHAPGVPLMPRMILNEELPWYAKTIQQGEVLHLSRLPDDLPAEATSEQEYCIQVGLKSHLMIPLKMMDSVVGAIGFGSFRRYRDWPDDLIQRLRLVGDVVTVLQEKTAEIRKKMTLKYQTEFRSWRRVGRRQGARLRAGRPNCEAASCPRPRPEMGCPSPK